MAQTSFKTTLKRLRQASGLSQYALAKKGGISQQYLNELEAGMKTNPGIETVRRIAKALDLPVSAMFGETLMPREWWRPEREKDEPPRPLRMVAPDAPDSYLTREEAERAAQRLGYLVIARYKNKAGGVIRTPFRARHNRVQ